MPQGGSLLPLPLVDVLVVIHPLDVDVLLGVLGVCLATGDGEVLHLSQRLPQGIHVLCSDLDHDAICESAQDNTDENNEKPGRGAVRNGPGT